ncbi:cation diffusion facilitator family transporter [Aminipila luticellarii]|uniref:Cation transporter n=1 Tax=Aminipila luticellarii TaxID=2507160 RepID=A0A410PYC5_9FIRM|nr:cation diffusion facilitator family transporter [Aminipila luticellarii]QAT43982.1 cation transporter [Aminipila luticellarii]
MGAFLFKTFIKDYENTNDPAVREKYGLLTGVVGIISNVILCIMKVVIGIITGSIAIIADGINNLTDASSSAMTLVGFKLAAKPGDEGHPYGHARIEYLTGLLISVVIILLGFQLFKTSFDKVLHPEPVQFSYLTLIILAISIAVKIWQCLFYISAGKKIHSLTLTATGTDSRNDVIATSAVLISIIIGRITGIQLDGIMGCVVAVFILWSGIQLIRETSSPLLGEAPDPELVHAILNYAESCEGVIGTHDLMVHNYGPGRIFASIHIEVDAERDIMESHDMIDNIERALSKNLRINLTVHMDPVKLNDPLTEKLRTVLEQTIEPLDGVYSIHDLRLIPGPTHTNIIFDMVTAPDSAIKQSEIQAIIDSKIKEIDPSYFVRITFDTAYIRP